MTAPTAPLLTDPIPSWERDLRAAVVTGLAPAEAARIGGAVAAGAVAATVAAVVAAAEGGMTMTTTISAAGTSHLGVKIAAGALAAALAAGGTAAVTGNLPDTAQRFAADAAAHIGLSLPRPELAATTTTIQVGTAGSVVVGLDGGALVLAGIDAAAGVEATVVSHTGDAILVEFRSALESTTVLLTEVDGRISSDIEVTAGGDAGFGLDAGAEGGLEVDIGR